MPSRRGGQVRGQARDHASGVDRMETVHVFARVDRFDHFLFRDVFRQGQLYDESVHVGIVVQFGDFSEQVDFADRSSRRSTVEPEAPLRRSISPCGPRKSGSLRRCRPGWRPDEVRGVLRPPQASTSAAISLRSLAATSFPSMIVISVILCCR